MVFSSIPFATYMLYRTCDKENFLAGFDRSGGGGFNPVAPLIAPLFGMTDAALLEPSNFKLCLDKNK